MLPGQRDGSQLWFESVSGFLNEKLGFEHCSAYPSLLHSPCGECLILLHVDDMLVVTEQHYFEGKLLPTINGRYKTSVHCMKQPGDTFEFLKRIHVLVDDATIHIQQNPRHFDKLFEVVGVQSTMNPKKVPCHEIMTEVDDTPLLQAEKASRYRSAVGILLYLSTDLVECSYTIRGLAQSMSAPTERSWTMMKHLCLYLLSVRDFSLRLQMKLNGLWHSPPDDNGVVIELFSDSDWAAHKGHRRSVSAGIVCFQGCLLLSTSRTQRVIALSSAEAEIHAAVSTTCDGLLLRVCLEFCIGCKVRLKLILDNSAAKQVLHRSGVGRIRHLSCRVLWVQQLVKTKALETSSIPTKENFADLGTKKLSADRMRYLMHGVGVYDESAGELVGTDVVTRERAADDVRGVLRMLRESIGERSSHKTMVATKRSLQTLLLLSLVHSTDALSLTSPISFSVREQLQLHGLSCWMVSIVILFFMFASLLIAMPPRHSMLEEPEPEDTSGSAAVSSSSPAPKYNKAAVYCFLCICLKRSLELIDEAEAEDDSAKTSALHAIYEVFMDSFGAFERDGISPASLQSMKDMHGALNVHDPDFKASDFMTIELDNGFTMSTLEPEIESLLPPDPPDDFFAEEMAPPFEPRSPEHMAMWMIQRLTEKLRFEMESGNPGVLKHVERREIMVNLCRFCNEGYFCLQTLPSL